MHAAEREARAAEDAIAAHRRSAEEEVRRYLAAARLQVDAESAARAARIETLSTAARRLADELTDAVAALARELHADERDAPMRVPRAPWPTTPPARTEPAPAPAAAAPSEPAPAPAPAAAAPSEPAPAPAPADTAPSEPAPAQPAAAPEPSWSRVEAPEPAIAATGSHDGVEPLGQADTAVPSAARLVAIEMAVGGSSRAEVEQHLRVQLGVAEPEPLLDDVFGVASHAGSRLAWGEP